MIKAISLSDQLRPFSHKLSALKQIDDVQEKSELGYSWESELKTRIRYQQMVLQNNKQLSYVFKELKIKVSIEAPYGGDDYRRR